MKEIPGAKPYFFHQENNISKEIKKTLILGNLSQGKNIRTLEKKTSKSALCGLCMYEMIFDFTRFHTKYPSWIPKIRFVWGLEVFPYPSMMRVKIYWYWMRLGVWLHRWSVLLIMSLYGVFLLLLQHILVLLVIGQIRKMVWRRLKLFIARMSSWDGKQKGFLIIIVGKSDFCKRMDSLR